METNDVNETRVVCTLEEKREESNRQELSFCVDFPRAMAHKL